MQPKTILTTARALRKPLQVVGESMGRGTGSGGGDFYVVINKPSRQRLIKQYFFRASSCQSR